LKVSLTKTKGKIKEFILIYKIQNHTSG